MSQPNKKPPLVREQAVNAEGTGPRLFVAEPRRQKVDHDFLTCHDALIHTVMHSGEWGPSNLGVVVGCCLLDVARSNLATSAYLSRPDGSRQTHGSVNPLERAFDVMLWIDDDMIFEPDALLNIAKLALERQTVVAGVASQRAIGGLPNISPLPGVNNLSFFLEGGEYEVFFVGTAAMAVPWNVLHAVGEQLYEDFGPVIGGEGKPIVPFFHPLIRGGYYWGEDSSFCRRANDEGYPILVSTKERIGHKGEYVYWLEDIQRQAPKSDILRLKMNGPPPEYCDAMRQPRRSLLRSLKPLGLGADVPLPAGVTASSRSSSSTRPGVEPAEFTD